MLPRTAVLVALIACEFGCGTPTGPAPAPAPALRAPDVVDAAVAAAAPIDASPPVALAARLASRGYAIEVIDAAHTLACGANGGCVCLAELDCHGSCVTLAENLAIFADARRTGTVSCEIADTGKLCDFSFFRFEGDIYRWEQRYFAPSGRLAGIRNATDYAEYCGGRARVQFAGVVPDCGQAPRDVEVLCSDRRTHAPVANPAAQLDHFLDGR